MKNFRLIFVFFLLLILNTVSSGQNSGIPYFFIQVTDPQFGMYSGNKEFSKETVLYKGVIEAINRLHPDFVVFTGDLVNEKDNREQIAEFKRLTATIDKGILLYYSPGNHDIGQAPAQADIDEFISDYGHDRFFFNHKGSAFIGLNSCLIKSQTPELGKIHFDWLKEKLSDLEEAEHIILFTHYPFFIQWHREPETYSNIPKNIRKKYLRLFKEKGVDAVFAGHLHNNSSAKYGDLDMITTSASGKPLGREQSGLRVIKVYNESIESIYYPLEEIPEKISFSDK